MHMHISYDLIQPHLWVRSLLSALCILMFQLIGNCLFLVLNLTGDGEKHTAKVSEQQTLFSIKSVFICKQHLIKKSSEQFLLWAVSHTSAICELYSPLPISLCFPSPNLTGSRVRTHERKEILPLAVTCRVFQKLSLRQSERERETIFLGNLGLKNSSYLNQKQGLCCFGWC